MVIVALLVTLDHIIVMLLGQPEGSMVIVCAQRGKVGSMLWWARAIEVHLDYCGINTLNSIQRNYVFCCRISCNASQFHGNIEQTLLENL